jgi:hypothetical protein
MDMAALSQAKRPGQKSEMKPRKASSENSVVQALFDSDDE